MRSSILLLAAAIVGCTAREELMFLPGFGTSGTPIVATVLEAGPDATTYVIGCPAASKAANCRGYEHPVIATQGQYTAHYYGKFLGVEGKRGEKYEYNQDYACKLDPQSTVCTISYGGPYVTHSEFLAEHSTATTYTLNADEISRAVMTVPIVTDTASIMNYGTDVYGKPTIYDARETGSVTTSIPEDAQNPIIPSQTARTVSPTELPPDEQERSTGTSTVDPTSPPKKKTHGGMFTDAQVTGLKVLGAIAFGGLILVSMLD